MYKINLSNLLVCVLTEISLQIFTVVRKIIDISWLNALDLEDKSQLQNRENGAIKVTRQKRKNCKRRAEYI
jgi:hypothetical protein